MWHYFWDTSPPLKVPQSFYSTYQRGVYKSNFMTVFKLTDKNQPFFRIFLWGKNCGQKERILWEMSHYIWFHILCHHCHYDSLGCCIYQGKSSIPRQNLLYNHNDWDAIVWITSESHLLPIHASLGRPKPKASIIQFCVMIDFFKSSISFNTAYLSNGLY